MSPDTAKTKKDQRAIRKSTAAAPTRNSATSPTLLLAQVARSSALIGRDASVTSGVPGPTPRQKS